MQERLQKILSQERLTPARFAELVGVQRSSVSHILSGRNKPSLDFLQKTLTTFGHINPDWLITGNGNYKRNAAENRFSLKNKGETGRINFPPSKSLKEEDPVFYEHKKAENEGTGQYPAGAEQPNSKRSAPSTNSEKVDPVLPEKAAKTVVKTILFYDDHTFEVFFPG